MSKCFSVEAKNFEKKLEDLGITYDQFREICKMHEELTQSGKCEVDNMLRKSY